MPSDQDHSGSESSSEAAEGEEAGVRWERRLGMEMVVVVGSERKDRRAMIFRVQVLRAALR